MNLQQHNISDNNFEQCIKCTVCTVYCPVAAVNPDYPGPKPVSYTHLTLPTT